MSITETRKIDIIATRPNSSIVKLVIADHLEWDDLDAHAKLIQEKINTYLEFIESGQLARTQTPPLPKAPRVHIELALQHEPSREAQQFLSRVREFLGAVGIEFTVELRALAGC